MTNRVQPALAPFNDVIAARNGHCLRLSSRAATPPGDEIVEAPVIARRRSDRCEGPALLRSQHDAEKLVETYERAADAFLSGSISSCVENGFVRNAMHPVSSAAARTAGS